MKTLSVKNDLYPLLLEQLFGSELAKQTDALRSLRSTVKALRKDHRASQLNVDYANTSNQNAYLLSYYPFQSIPVYELLKSVDHASVYLNKQSLNVCLVGGGPAPEAIGLLDFLRDAGIRVRKICFHVLDAYDWQRAQQITRDLVARLFPDVSVSFSWTAMDFHKPSQRALSVLEHADLVTIQYILSDLNAVGRSEARKNVVRILNSMKPNALLLIADGKRVSETSLLPLLCRDIIQDGHGIALYQDQSYHAPDRIRIPRIMNELLTGESGLIPRKTVYCSALIAISHPTQSIHPIKRSKTGHLTASRQQKLRALARNLRNHQVSVHTLPYIDDEIAPDLVMLLHGSRVVYVVEVRLWSSIAEGDEGWFYVKDDESQNTHEAYDPLLIARDYCDELAMLFDERRSGLVPYQGSDDLPLIWRPLVLMPFVPQKQIDEMGKAVGWEKETVLGREYFRGGDSLRRALSHKLLPEEKVPPSHNQVQLLRGLTDGSQLLKRQDEIIGVLTQEQSSIIQRKIEYFEAKNQLQLLPEGMKNGAPANGPTIEMINGPAGSGKTIVLIERAKWLKNRYPESRILVLCFNRKLKEEVLIPQLSDYCEVNTFYQMAFDAGNYKRRKHERKNISGWLKEWFGDQLQELKKLDLRPEMIAREFEWRWELGLDDRKYLEKNRPGRGKALTRSQREKINELHAQYCQRKQQLRVYDWESDHRRGLDALAPGNPYYQAYDAVLIDEGQDFAPSWIELARRLLKPSGYLLVAYDPNQSVFRRYTWKDRGIDARGISKKLTIPFRNTRQISEAAHAIFQYKDSVSVQDEEDPIRIDLNRYTLTNAEFPELYVFRDSRYADAFLLHEIASEDSGTAAIIYYQQQPEFAGRSNRSDVSVLSARQVKGLEFDTVYAVNIHEFFTDVADDEEKRDALCWLHMVMTRARRRLVLTTVEPMHEWIVPLASSCQMHKWIDDRSIELDASKPRRQGQKWASAAGLMAEVT